MIVSDRDLWVARVKSWYFHDVLAVLFVLLLFAHFAYDVATDMRGESANAQHLGLAILAGLLVAAAPWRRR